MAAVISTAAIASQTAQSKQSGTFPVLTEVQLIYGLTRDLIKDRFPYLDTAPDALFIAMAIWGLESGWKLWHKKGNIIDSRHLTPSYPGTSPADKNKGLIPGYRWSDPIASYMSRGDITPDEKVNVSHGFVPHGITACMGCYYVRGTKTYNETFGRQQSLVDELGMSVNPGESITALFPNNELGKKRSIASGLIILQEKYRGGMRNFNNPSLAIEFAVGAYLGRGKDANGMTPEQRIKDVKNSDTRLGALKANGITRTGRAGQAYTLEMAALTRITPATNTVSNSPSGTIASTSSPPATRVGCTV